MPFFHVPFQEIVLQVRETLRVQQLLHGGFISLGGISFQFRSRRAETGAPQQVCHKANVFGHILASLRQFSSPVAMLYLAILRFAVWPYDLLF
jgi:hypothetical protein